MNLETLNPPTQELSESLENRIFQELQETTNERNQVWKEINKTFETAPNRKEAEKIVLKTLIPLMNEAIKKTDKLIAEWSRAMEKSQEKHEESSKLN